MVISVVYLFISEVTDLFDSSGAPLPSLPLPPSPLLGELEMAIICSTVPSRRLWHPPFSAPKHIVPPIFRPRVEEAVEPGSGVRNCSLFRSLAPRIREALLLTSFFFLSNKYNGCSSVGGEPVWPSGKALGW